MSDIAIRRDGPLGRITLTREGALNAVTHDMVLAIDTALADWAGDPAITAILIDAQGARAFSAGGDLAEMYDTARAGDFDYGRTFWRDEYRLNARIARYPKPYVALMQGFVMGGGVGVSCHGSHRVVCASSRIAMPECGIGLVPDVGGSLLLARAPGRLGEYLGTTGTRMGPADAIFAGFADCLVPQDRWPDLTAALLRSGDPAVIDDVIHDFTDDPGLAPLAAEQALADRFFAAPTARAIVQGLDRSDWCAAAQQAMRRGSPLSVACTVDLVRRARAAGTIDAALAQEYRFTARSAERGDFIEGIRAAIIDKDRTPRWQHARIEDVTDAEIAAMLAPLPTGDLG